MVLGLALITGLAISFLARMGLIGELLPLGILVFLLAVVLRVGSVVAASVVVVAIFIDFYELIGLPLHEPIAALLLAVAYLAALFFLQSADFPWIPLRHLVPWSALLLLTVLALPRGTLSQTALYFSSTFVAALVMFALGTEITRDGASLQRLLSLLSLIATFIACHSIVQGLTGNFLFATQRQIDYLGSVAGFQLRGTTLIRAGSFLGNPDWNGAFLALMVFIPAGLLFSATTRAAKVLYAIEVVLIVLALLCTFTTASWLSAGAGMFVYIGVAVPRQYRTRAVVALGLLIIGLAVFFPLRAQAFLQHATASNEVTLRLGAWETALRVIQAHPLTGLGMGGSLYIVRAEPFRVPLQTRPLAHPHNTYLELAAFAGIPVLIAFLVVLALLFREAVKRFSTADPHLKPMLGGAFTGLVVLSMNSLAINGWTLPPLAVIAWLLMGAITSPALQLPRVLSPRHGTDTLQSSASTAGNLIGGAAV
jgi:hypothetical protein